MTTPTLTAPSLAQAVHETDPESIPSLLRLQAALLTALSTPKSIPSDLRDGLICQLDAIAEALQGRGDAIKVALGAMQAAIASPCPPKPQEAPARLAA